MRERLWWTLRHSRFVQRLMAWPWLAAILRRISHVLLPSSVQSVQTVEGGLGEGLRLELISRWESHIWRGTYEPVVQPILAQYLKPGRTVYDVGGGIGFYALAGARLGARMFTFEPDPHNIKCIESNAQLNGLDDRFDLLRVAAFSRSGTLMMEASGRQHGRHGHAHAKEIWDSGARDVFEAACITLDDFARDHPPPDLVKIDVEGCEAEVVKGASRLMREARPAILVEVHGGALGNDVDALIRSRGYTTEWLDDPSYPVRWIYATPG